MGALGGYDYAAGGQVGAQGLNILLTWSDEDHVGLDRIDVMAELNITNDFLLAETEGSSIDETVSTRLRNLTERVETALQKGQQMDL